MKDAASAVLVAAVEGFDLTPEEDRFFRSECPAGVTLFKWNIPQEDYSSVGRLNTKLRELCGTSGCLPIIAIDQEGGRVSRLPRPFPNLGPPFLMLEGEVHKKAQEHFQNYGEQIGRELLKLGINVNFAPVLDIWTEATNRSIGDRCFGSTPEQVALRAGAFLKGLQKSGVRGCLKHFPGQGDARVDTHLGTANIPISLNTLVQRELYPFKSCVPFADLVMISHSIYPVLSDQEAGLSDVVIKDWLRSRLGFSGVVVSDDMNMGAIPSEIRLWQEALVEAVVAGCDLLLVCRHLERCVAALEGLRREAARSPAFEVRLNEAAMRVTKFRKSLQ